MQRLSESISLKILFVGVTPHPPLGLTMSKCSLWARWCPRTLPRSRSSLALKWQQLPLPRPQPLPITGAPIVLIIINARLFISRPTKIRSRIRLSLLLHRLPSELASLTFTFDSVYLSLFKNWAFESLTNSRSSINFLVVTVFVRQVAFKNFIRFRDLFCISSFNSLWEGSFAWTIPSELL